MIQIKENGYLREKLKLNDSKKCRLIILLLMAIAICINSNFRGLLIATASEIQRDENEQTKVYVLALDRMNERLSEGLLDTPERFQRQAVLYEWILAAVNQYVTEKGIEDTFCCDLKKDILNTQMRFIINNPSGERKEYPYEYYIENDYGIDMSQESYKLKLEGKENVLYLDIQVQEKKVYIYPAEWECLVISDNSDGNITAYEQIERDSEGQITYYPDTYVRSDWINIECIDDHFAGTTIEELEQLEYLKVPEGAGDSYDASLYLSVAGVLKRYVEENKLKDSFYFNADQDVIARVTNMIFTCRLRGREKTLYMDIDRYHMKAHVYEVEEW